MKTQKIEMVELSKLVADKNQPRQEFNPQDMERLKASIASRGILNPLVVEKMKDGKYLIVDGERRYRASTALKLKEVPVIIEDEMSVMERLISRFHLQEQHAGWSAFDKARAIRVLQRESSMTSSQIADMLGLSPKTVQEYLMLLNLSKRLISLAEQGRIPFSYFKAIGMIARLVDNVKLKEKLEEALIEKVDKQVITRYYDIKKYRLAVVKGGDKTIQEIISNKDLTGQEALSFAKANGEMLKDSVMQNIHWLSSVIVRAYGEKSFELLTNYDVSLRNKVIKNLTKFIGEANPEE